MNGQWTVEIIETSKPDGVVVPGERYCGEAPVSGISSSHIVRGACEVCWHHGRNFACPPHSQFFPDWVKEHRTARVIFLRFPSDVFEGETPQGRARACSREARYLLNLELSEYQERGFKVAGAGPCRSCEVCAAERGDSECYAPGRRIYSLESMGVNVVELVNRVFGIDLDWEGAEGSMLGAVGCVFDPEDRAWNR